MLAHYIPFFYTVKKCIFFVIEGIYNRWSDRRNHVDYGTQEEGFLARLIMKSLLQLQFPVIPWVVTKYQYHFPISLFLGAISIIMGPLVYFHSLLWPQSEFSFSVSIIDSNCSTYLTLVGENDFSMMHHWHETLSILNFWGVLIQILYMIAAAILQDQDVTLLMTMFLVFGTSVYVWSKDYLETHVKISKI